MLQHKLRRWADARDRRNPFGHGKTGTALLREAADYIQELEERDAAGVSPLDDSTDPMREPSRLG